jgi:uncharacterized protein YjbI with pentapeptide repeats
MKHIALAAFVLAAAAAVPSQAGTPPTGSVVTNGCPHCTLTGKDFSNQCLQSSNFQGADLDDAKLVLTCLSHANLKEATLRRADLSGANLFDTNLDATDFTGAVMSSTSLKGTDLTRSKGLTQAQLNGACGDTKTRAPAGLKVPMCQ